MDGLTKPNSIFALDWICEQELSHARRAQVQRRELQGMKSTPVKYFCDLCGKEVTKNPCLRLFMGSVFFVCDLNGTWKKIDLCEKCRKLIRENGYIEKRSDKK